MYKLRPDHIEGSDGLRMDITNIYQTQLHADVSAISTDNKQCRVEGSVYLTTPLLDRKPLNRPLRSVILSNTVQCDFAKT